MIFTYVKQNCKSMQDIDYTNNIEIRAFNNAFQANSVDTALPF